MIQYSVIMIPVWKFMLHSKKSLLFFYFFILEVTSMDIRGGAREDMWNHGLPKAHNRSVHARSTK
jgi:hypothetical protein